MDQLPFATRQRGRGQRRINKIKLSRSINLRGWPAIVLAWRQCCQQQWRTENVILDRFWSNGRGWTPFGVIYLIGTLFLIIHISIYVRPRCEARFGDFQERNGRTTEPSMTFLTGNHGSGSFRKSKSRWRFRVGIELFNSSSMGATSPRNR